MTVVNTNVAALQAQNSSRLAQSSLNTSIQRLSSGLRINSSADDASGLAVATRITSDIRGFAVDVRNANDGISLAQTADGALGQVTDILQRARELAVQSANGAISNGDRQNIQAELTQLVSQVDSISKSTTFNGINLLDGSAKNLTLQTGVRSGDTIAFGIANASAKSLGLLGARVQGQADSGRVASGSIAIANADDVLINSKAAFAAPFTASTTDNANKLAAAINANVGQTRVTASAYNTVTGSAPTQTSFAAGAVTINGASIGAAGSTSELVDNINRDAPGVTAVLNQDGTIGLSNNTGKDITVAGSAPSAAGLTAGTYTGYLSLSSLDGTPITVQAKDAANGFVGGAGTVAEVQKLGFNQSSDGAAFTSSQVGATALSLADDVRINGVKVGPSTDSSALAKAAAVNALTSTTGVVATASTSVAVGLNFTNVAGANAVVISGSTIDLSGALNLTDVVNTINTAGINGLTATSNSQGQLILNSPTGADLTLTDASGFLASAQTVSGETGTGTIAAGEVFKGSLSLTSNNGGAIRVEDNVPGSSAKLGLSQQGGSSASVGGALSVATQASASAALTSIDAALNQVSLNRGDLGAIQNRLSVTVNNLQSVSTNLSQALSRVQDTDFSSETTNLAKSQILNQAATALLAQANQSQQGVLSLLPR